jgi:Tol biopolymer transport system component
LTSYEDLSLTADGKILVSTQREYSMGIWLTEEGDFVKAAQVQTNTGRDDGERGIAWTADGKIVYVSSEDEAQNIRRVDTDGTNEKPLTSGNEFGKVYPTLAADTGLITYLSDGEKGLFLWQMDSEGQNVRQVNNDGNADFQASANKDWVVYTSHQDGKNRIFKTSVGGEPIKLTDTESIFPVISPDGKQVAYIEQEKGKPQKIAVISIDGGNALKSFELPATVKTDAGIAWNKEGNAVLFINTLGTISNIWQQTFDGKPSKPVTDFKEFQIAAFALNPAGTRFAVSRGSRNRDAILLKTGGLK